MSDDGFPLHGGPDACGAPLHDFSTNANACGPCPHTWAALQASDVSRYPDPSYSALREQLASFHSVARERVVLAASASEFISRITAAVAMGRTDTASAVHVPAHAYGDYARAARAWGLQVRSDEGAQSNGTRLLTWACEPSTPLGQPQADLTAQIAAQPAHVPLVLDRAYEPLRLHGQSVLTPQQLDRLWQLWSPNKALGLTGVRGAYAIAPKGNAASALLEKLARLAPSWPLGAHAVTMLQCWSSERAQRWLAQCLPTLREWKAAQQQWCQARGWYVHASDSNYFCADVRDALGSRSLQDVLERMRAGGVKLRDCGSFGLPGHVRLGVRGPHSALALAGAWREATRPGR